MLAAVPVVLTPIPNAAATALEAKESATTWLDQHKPLAVLGAALTLLGIGLLARR